MMAIAASAGERHLVAGPREQLRAAGGRVYFRDVQRLVHRIGWSRAHPSKAVKNGGAQRIRGQAERVFEVVPGAKFAIGAVEFGGSARVATRPIRVMLLDEPLIGPLDLR